MSENAYVVGVDMIKFGRFPDRAVPEIGAQSALMALDDAGLKIQDMEALYCGNLMQANAMVGQRILHLIGQTGIPVVNCANACATGATAFREGWMAVKAGVYDLVLCVGVEQMGKAGLLGGGTSPKGGSGETLNRASYLYSSPYDAVFIASLRFVADLSDPDKVMALVSGGVSGRQFEPHLKDQLDAWHSGAPAYWWFSDEAIEANAVTEQLLEPN